MSRSLASCSLSLLLVSSACVGSVGGPAEVDPGDDGDGSGGGGGGGGGGGDDTCASIEVALSETIPTVMLLVDQSGSMDQGFGGTSRWNAIGDTLVNDTTGVVKRLEQKVRFGVAFYTSNDGNAGGTCPVITPVMPAMGNFVSIRDMYNALDPVEDTPTAPSVTVAKTYLDQVTEPGPKILVLATDGLPDTCAVPDPETTEAQADSVAAVQAAHAGGVDVYVISVGPDVTQQHLQDVANAGVGLPVGGAENAPYYQALNTDSLVSAFDTIIGGVRSCTFTVDGTVDLDQAADGTVTLDGTELEYGTEWDMVNATTLELLGGACDAIMQGSDHDISAQFTCGSIVD